MQKYTKALDYREAYKLMEARDVLGQPVPFDVEFIPVGGGRRQTAYGVICTSVAKNKGMRRIYYPESGQFRWIYDVLITQINDTRILVRLKNKPTRPWPRILHILPIREADRK